MQGGKYAILLFLVCIAIGASMAMADAPTAEVGGAGGTHGGLPVVGFNLLDPLGFHKHSRDIVQAAIKLPKPKDYILSFMRVSAEQFRGAINNVAEMAKQADDSLNKMAVDDCKELLNDAIDELQESLSSVSDCPIKLMMQILVDLKNWLSAVLTYSNTCIDGFSNPNLQSSIHNFLKASTLHAGQALSVVTVIPQILAGLKIHGHGHGHAHGHANMAASGGVGFGAHMGGGGHGGFGGMGGGHGGFGGMGGGGGHGGFGGMGGGGHQQFPMWMPRADRRLLMSKQGGGPGRGGVELRPNAVVAKDGSGQFTTITDALAAYKPKKNDNSTRHVIYVKAGVYNEDILVQKKQINLFMYGDGPRKTVITGKKCFRDGVSTFRTAPFSVVGNGFICKSMGFENTAGPEGHQAVALRVQSDMSAFYNCRMDGYQDTLYAHTHRQFYSNCVISGTIDFIFGDAAAVFQDCTIVVRKPMDNQKNIVTAHGRTHFAEPTGLVIQNCQFVAEDGLIAKKAQIKSYLGRPWKPYSRTVIMESTIGDFIDPEGWMPWTGTLGLDTLYYAEYRNRGPAADTSRRVNWKGYHVLRNSKEAMKFTVDPFIQGSEWLPATGAPFFVGLKAAK
nr:pectinesterase-like [Ipomoea batatas]